MNFEPWPRSYHREFSMGTLGRQLTMMESQSPPSSHLHCIQQGPYLNFAQLAYMQIWVGFLLEDEWGIEWVILNAWGEGCQRTLEVTFKKKSTHMDGKIDWPSSVGRISTWNFLVQNKRTIIRDWVIQLWACNRERQIRNINSKP